MPQLLFTAGPADEGKRLDVVIARAAAGHNMELTRSGLKAAGAIITVNGKTEKPGSKVRAGDSILVHLPEPAPSVLAPKDMGLEIVYSDGDIAVVNKPWGVAVHPSKGHENDTLVNGLLFQLKGGLSSVGGIERPGIVHRLDKDTAGLMVVALNDSAHRRLAEDFKERRVKKTYHALVKGEVSPAEGKIETGIGRSPRDRKKMAVREDGRPAATEYRVLEYLKGHSYVEINLLTGRTHQIRVHFSHLGHPVAGDPVYSRGAAAYRLPGIALCAKKLEFQHPSSGRPMEFEIKLPAEFAALLKRLRAG